MDEVKIQLPEFLIAELYKGSLVDLDTFKLKDPLPEVKDEPMQQEARDEAMQKIKFLGENEKRVTILVNEPRAVFLMEDDLTFLTNILKACQLNLADIAIINTASQNVKYDAIKDQLHAQNILLFDVEPSAISLPFLIPVFQLQKFDGCTIMVAPPLPYLNKPNQEGKLLKTKLWLSLRQIFNIP